jgi:hypothetical protein
VNTFHERYQASKGRAFNAKIQAGLRKTGISVIVVEPVIIASVSKKIISCRKYKKPGERVN